MSVELVDFRGRITPETDAMLEGTGNMRDSQGFHAPGHRGVVA